MEIEIEKREENKLLNRLEVRFLVRQGGGPTPDRARVREELTKQLKAKDKVLVVDRIRTQFGRENALGYAKVYDSLEDARRVERPHVLRRNGLMEGAE